MPTVSASWKASEPIRWVGTWPVKTTIGIESISASASGVTMLVAPGSGRGERDAALAGGAGIAFGHVAGALLVADEDVAHLLLRVDRVVDRKDGAARIAEDRVDALVGKRAQYDLGARQLLASVLRVHLAVSVHLAARQCSCQVSGKRKRATGAL